MPLASFRRALVALPVLLAAVGAPAAHAAAPAVPSGAAKVSRPVCTTSTTDPFARAASFVVRVRSLPRTSSYGFAVVLQEQAPGGKWQTLKGAAAPPGLGAFVAARPGATTLVRRLTVRSLRIGHRYRLRVSYRWTGGTPRAVRRTSRTCTVRDLRPQVGLTGEIGWQPGTAGGEVAYRIGVRSTRFEELRGVDVPIVVRQGTAVLASGTFRPTAAADVVLLPGRRCAAGEPVTVAIDPTATLEATVRTGDALAAACVPVSR